jgi:type VI secretion system protein ImpA
MAEGPLDLETLLAPLAEGDGAGVDLREDFSATSPYQKLRDARSEARAEERARDAGGEQSGVPPEAWRTVRRVAEQAIGATSKDFEVAAWLTEALTRTDGLAGLEAGARLLAGLLERYWDNGFPVQDEEGFEARIAPLGGLAGGDTDGTVMQPLRRMALFRRADGSEASLYAYEQAEETAGLADEKRRKQRYGAGVAPLADLQNEAKLDLPRLRAVARAARAAREAWRAFDAAAEARLGSQGPTTRRVADVLERIVAVADLLAGGPELIVEEAAPEAEGEPMAEGAEAPAGGAPAARAAGPIQSREDALRQLEKLADWFKRTEPHSPLAYTLEEAVRRGRMTLPELLGEVLGDDAARQGMLTMLGIRPGQGG